MSRRRVLIVGAGLAGLLLARELAIADAEVTVFDAAAEPGGRLAGVWLAGRRLPGAVESFRSGGAALQALTTQLGLDLVRPVQEARWLIGPDQSASVLPGSMLLGIPVPTMSAEVLAIIGTRAALRAELDAVIPMLRPGKYRDLGRLVQRRLGRRMLEEVVAPVARARYGLRPEALAIDEALPGLRGELTRRGSLTSAAASVLASRAAAGEEVGLRGGTNGLVELLAERAERVGVEIRTNARVESVESTALRLDTGEQLEGEVILATPRGPARPGRAPVVAHVAVDSAELDAAPRGRGAVVAAGEIRARSFTHSSATWDWLAEALPAHRHLVRLAYDEAPEDPRATVAADLRAITGVRDASVVDLVLRSEGPAANVWPRGVTEIEPRGDLDAAVAAALAAAAAWMPTRTEHEA